LAPGADETGGIAALLELARVFKVFPARRTMMFVALSGHDLALQGAREFVDKHFDEIGSRIKALVNLDLSAERDELVSLWVGQFYQYDLNPGRFMWVSQKIFNEYLPRLYQSREQYSGKVINGMDISSWRSYITQRLTLDSEPFTMAGGLGFSVVTAKASGRHWNTPSDTSDYLHLQNIKTQTDLISWLVHSLADENQLPEYRANRFSPSGGGFPVLKGRVVQYNFETGWFDPVPNALVFLEGEPDTILYNHKTVLISDENGEVEFKGCLQSVVFGGGIYATRYYTMSAYVDNPSSGPIEYATDFGKYGGQMYPGKITIDKGDNFATIAVFKCGSIALFDCLDPSSLEPTLPGFQVMEQGTFVTPDQWGACSDQGISLISVPAGISVRIIMSKLGDSQPIALLENVTSENDMEGTGYRISSIGECLRLYFTPLLFTEDGMLQLVNYRLNVSQARGLRPVDIEEAQKKVAEHVRLAHDALDSKQYDTFYFEALKAWGLEVQAYRDIKGLMQDAINTILYFFVLLIPFSIMIESLLFNFSKGSHRLVAASMILGVFIVILYFVHPGFLLPSNIYMILIGLVVVVLISPVLAIVAGETLKYLGELRHRFIGAHFTSISRLGALTTSFSIGISYMKRRRLRTVLTLTAITLITFSLISFASFMSFSIIGAQEKSGTTLYNGVLIRSPSWSALSDNLLQYVEAQYGKSAIVCPRAWLYTSLKLTNARGVEYSASSILGAVSSETALTGFDAILTEGSWIKDETQKVCIVSKQAADTLGVKVNDTVTWKGFDLIVAGIVDSQQARLKTDLDQESLMPLYPLQPSIEKNVHSFPEDVVIIPFSLARAFGAQIFSVAVMPENSTGVYEIAKGLANTLTSVNIYGGFDGRLFFYVKGVGHAFYGWELIMVPLTIAAFIILNSVLSSVHERAKEIAIYSSIGLSPTHIAGLFIIESIVYAVLGSVLGYSLGIVTYPILNSLGALPSDIPLNYSSSWVIITLSVCMLVTLLSTIYPTYKASRLVTPSVERSWKIATRPTGDEWTIPMPFVATTEEEALGIFAFLYEFFEAHAVERTDAVFATKEISFCEEGASKTLVLRVRLTPFEMGVVQEVRVGASIPADDERYHFGLYLKRIDGILNIWKMSNRRFADEVRKQLLIWRGLVQEDKEEYMKRASKLAEIKNERGKGKVGTD
jgi:ABC-type antimicrobial peptide transport system permease subunit